MNTLTRQSKRKASRRGPNVAVRHAEDGAKHAP